MVVKGILLLKSLLGAKILFLNKSSIAVCMFQMNSGLALSLLGLLLACTHGGVGAFS